MSAHDNLSTGATGQFSADSLPARTGDPKPATGIDLDDHEATSRFTDHSIRELGDATRASKQQVDGK